MVAEVNDNRANEKVNEQRRALDGLQQVGLTLQENLRKFIEIMENAEARRQQSEENSTESSTDGETHYAPPTAPRM